MTKIQRYKSVLACFSDAALLISSDGMTIESINASGCEMLNCESLVAPLPLSHLLTDSRVIQSLTTVVAQGDVMRLENVAIHIGQGGSLDCIVELSAFDEETVCCVLKLEEDVTEALDRYTSTPREIEEFVRTSMSNTKPELLFRYVVATSEIFYFGSLQKEGMLPDHCENYPHDILKLGLVHLDDQEEFLNFTENVRQGIEQPSIYRIYNKCGEPIWFKKEYGLRRDEDGNVIEAIGRLVNVHSEKELEQYSHIDELTGCLRKQIFESYSSAYLTAHPTEKHALIIVDLDNFKAINDNLGHQFGDNVLHEVGTKLRGLFRNSDFVGRIGGDEFMIFMKSLNDHQIAEIKSQEILALLDTTYSGTSHSYRISSSIGIARYPDDGGDLSELYDHADIAMYDAKNRGKNNMVVYNDTLSKGTMVNTMPFDVAARTLSQHFDPKIVAEVFNLLFESNDIDISMQSVLKNIGSRFGTSRSYIFELSADETKNYRNTYEWCADGITAEIENLQHVPLEILHPFFGQANGEGILYCNDLTTLNHPEAHDLMAAQNIQSFLHAYIGPKEAPLYVIGFDDCKTTRIWRPIEISTLLHVSKIIGQFLNHQKALQMESALYTERMDALESMSFSAYIIDSDTHELLFANKEMLRVLPDLKSGDICYQVIRGNDSECSNCPMKYMRENGLSAHRAIIYNSKLQVPYLVNTTYLDSYDGRRSVFLAANDISDLIKGDCSEFL